MKKKMVADVEGDIGNGFTHHDGFYLTTPAGIVYVGVQSAAMKSEVNAERAVDVACTEMVNALVRCGGKVALPNKASKNKDVYVHTEAIEKAMENAAVN